MGTASRAGRVLATIAVMGMTIGALAACSSSPERSAAVFCSTMESEQQRILEQFENQVAAGEASGDDLVAVLTGLGASIAALGELSGYFDALEEVAPEEIRRDVAELAAGYRDQLDAAKGAASDPLGAIGEAIFGGLLLSGPTDRVNQFALDNCGRSI